MIESVVILGAGLSGLTSASILRSRGVEALVLEAAPVPGGRIRAARGADGRGVFDLGPTWFADKHVQLCRVADGLGVERFEQYTARGGLVDLGPAGGVRELDHPPPDEPTYRFAGGTIALVDALVATLDPSRLRTSVVVRRIEDRADALLLHTDDGGVVRADRVISTLPPRHLARTVEVEPPLPPAVRHVLAGTPTWMGHVVKFWARYEAPFWRERGGGFAVGHVGIVEEVHDHSSADETVFALTGFLRPGSHLVEAAERRRRWLEHLVRFFGEEAGRPLEHGDLSWPDQPFVSDREALAAPLGTRYGDPRLMVPQLHGRLLISGSECAASFGGYMEGAVTSGLRAAAWALQPLA